VASKTHWSEVLGDKVLPVLTDATLTCLPLFPTAAIVAVVATFSIGLVRRSPSVALWGIFLTVAAEACLLAVAALGVVLPALSITYRMSPWGTANHNLDVIAESCASSETSGSRYMRKMKNHDRELALWMLATAVIYPLLCFLAVIMMVSGGIMPEPWDPPPPWHIVIIARLGKAMALVLMWPFILIGKHRPFAGVPGLDYLWMVLLGFLLGGVLCSLKRFVKTKIKKHVTSGC
jgi:hypothetical protein